MKKSDIARALRDPEYRECLTDAQAALLPDHPAGIADIDDDVLHSVGGGCCAITVCSACISTICASYCY